MQPGRILRSCVSAGEKFVRLGDADAAEAKAYHVQLELLQVNFVNERLPMFQHRLAALEAAIAATRKASVCRQKASEEIEAALLSLNLSQVCCQINLKMKPK